MLKKPHVKIYIILENTQLSKHDETHFINDNVNITQDIDFSCDVENEHMNNNW